MRAGVDILAQVVQRFPDRHVDHDPFVAERRRKAGVVFNLQTKPELRSATALISSTCATKAAILGSPSGRFKRPTLIFAR